MPTTLVQKRPEVLIGGAFGSAMKTGFLMRGSVDRARSEIEDHLSIREIIESGEYKQIVADAGETVSSVKRLEPMDAFLKLCGTSKATYSKREKELRELGVETVSQLRSIGVPYKSIRLLADSPAALTREVQAEIASGAATRETVEALLDKVLELEDSRRAANDRAEAAKRDSEKATSKLHKSRDKVAELDEELKLAKSELKQARAGNKTKGEAEIADAFARFSKFMLQAFEQLEGVDLSVPHAMMLAERAMNAAIGQCNAVRASYIEFLE